MKRKVTIKKQFLFGLSAILFVLLSSCGVSPEKARKPSEDFSRGLLLGAEASSNPAVAVEPSGDLIQVVIPYENEEDGINFRYVQVDGKAVVKIDQDLLYTFGDHARSPKMISNGDQLYLIWASRERTTEGWQLWYGMVNQLGEITAAPRWISQGTERVSQFEVSGDGTGGAIVLWEDSDLNEIKFTRLSSTGEISSLPQVLVENGDRPSLQIDSNGNFHLAWMEEENLYYSKLDGDISFPIQSDRLAIIQIAMGNRMDGPVLGSSSDDVYVFWSILRQTGLVAGTAITEYLVFPEKQPGRLQKGLVTIFPASEDRFSAYEGDLSLSQIITPPPEEYLSTDYIYAPQTGSGFNDTLVIAVAANQAIRLDAYVQIVIGFFVEGEYQGYTLATRTTRISQKPQVTVDNKGNLHLVWQDGSVGNRVYYATTASQAKTRLDRVSFSDLPNLILSGGLEAITGILLFPFAFPWMAVGLLILIIWRLIRNDEDMSIPISKVLLGVALLSYQISKLLFLPDIMIYVPFSAWLDIPPGMGLFLKIAVPLVIFGVGFAVAEWRRRQRTSPPSALSYYLFVILVDTVLTLAIYGVIFLGEY